MTWKILNELTPRAKNSSIELNIDGTVISDPLNVANALIIIIIIIIHSCIALYIVTNYSERLLLSPETYTIQYNTINI